MIFDINKLDLGLTQEALDVYWRQVVRNLEKKDLGTIERQQLVKIEAKLKAEILKYQGL